jgi:hypothetical protein
VSISAKREGIVGLEAIARETEFLSVETATLIGPWLKARCIALRAALADEASDAKPSDPWYWSLGDESSSPGAIDRPLWLHRTYHLLAQDGSTADLAQASRMLTPNFADEHTFSDFTFRPGIDVSVLVRSHNSIDSCEWIMDLMAHEHAYLAAISEVDRSVLQAMSSLSRSDGSSRPRTSDVEANAISRTIETVRLFRNRMDTVLSNLGGASVHIVRSLQSVWATDQVVTSLDSKLETLQSLHRLRTEATTAHRARTLNRIALVFTAVSVVASAAALVDFSFGKRLSSPDMMRLSIACVITAICLFAASYGLRDRGLDG